ncbi:MAG TPA: GNAT family N-acetyltransferase [Candidatus Fimivivens faecavium]|nr:GNAT family N-acetyltransferase [Candidatus Fimivivens faecavium]
MEQIREGSLLIREAVPGDEGIILEMIKELASYEKLLDRVTATEEILRDSLFQRKKAQALLAEYEGVPAGYALYFYNFSTFQGKPGVYLEDLYVRPRFRKLGIGRRLLSALAQLAVEEDCGRLEWICLDWNEPSIRLYRRLGAKPVDGWTVYREEGEALTNLARLGPADAKMDTAR